VDPFKSSVEFDETLHLKFSSDGIEPFAESWRSSRKSYVSSAGTGALWLCLKQQVRLGVI
jgi:hypothetical protein